MFFSWVIKTTAAGVQYRQGARQLGGLVRYLPPGEKSLDHRSRSVCPLNTKQAKNVLISASVTAVFLAYQNHINNSTVAAPSLKLFLVEVLCPRPNKWLQRSLYSKYGKLDCNAMSSKERVYNFPVKSGIQFDLE